MNMTVVTLLTVLSTASAAASSLHPAATLSLVFIFPHSALAQFSDSKGSGGECVCTPPSAPPPEPAVSEEGESEEEEAEEEEATEEGEEATAAPPPPRGKRTDDDDSGEKCKSRDVQKLFISGSAGALLALAVVGQRRGQDANTWTGARDAEAQTYEEPRGPEVPMPPVVQYLPPQPPQPARPPAPQLVYDRKPKVPTRTTGTHPGQRLRPQSLL